MQYVKMQMTLNGYVTLVICGVWFLFLINFYSNSFMLIILEHLPNQVKLFKEEI